MSNRMKMNIQFFASSATMVADLIDPEVMADMINAKLPAKIKITPYAKIDNTLVGQPGDEITVPKYAYIGDAEDVAEGVAIGATKLSTSSTKTKVKKAGKAVIITDEAALSGYGNPVGEATNQLTMSVASKLDNDAMDELQKATLVYDGSKEVITYGAIVNAVDLFEEEDMMAKIMYVHPKQVTHLRLDPDFKDINKYPMKTLMTGVIGEIAGCQIIPSKKVPLKAGIYICPIVKTASDELDEDTPALTVYLKRDVLIESARDITTKTTTIVADKHYTVALSNESKVVLAKLKSTMTAPTV